MAQLCPRCGEENPERFRLCGFCGAELAPAAPPPEERKVVTILFSDLKGSTNLGEALDPESLREVMSRYFDEMTAAIRRHGGTVEKFIGDAIMAVFGLPRVREDDALRAVRAAIEMQRSLAELNVELAARWGVTLTNRTGVNTGEVVAGDVTGGQRLATGDAVNVAARLEQAAPPNDVLIGEPTYRLVRDAVEVEAIEPLELKGKTERVGAFRLLAARGSEGVARNQGAPMVGREAELASLLAALDAAEHERRCRLVTVIGEAGVGKSRLVREFLAAVADRSQILSGRCLSYGEGITFWPLLELIRAAAEVAPDDDAETLAARVRSLVPDHDVVDRLLVVLGVSYEQFPLAELFWAARKLLEHLAVARPVTVLIDDIHWAEPTFLDLLAHLLASIEDAPVLLVCTARHELLDRPGASDALAGSERIELAPLADDDAKAIVLNLLGSTGVDPTIQARVVEVAEGNPLFVEQLLSMLIDRGLLRSRDGRWVASEPLAELDVPPSIHALLAARLDDLPRPERSVIEPSSVIGLEFPQAAVAELVPAAVREEVPLHLAAMTRRQLVRPSPSSVVGDDAHRFQHILIRDAAYGSLLKRARATLHERFVEWADRDNRVRERALEFEEILGFHLEQAYRYLKELGPLDARGIEVGRRAAERLSSAGRRAFGRGDIPAATVLLQRAAETLADDDPTRLAILPDLAEALAEGGHFPAAKELLDEARAASERARNEPLRARADLVSLLVELQSGSLDGWSDRVLNTVASAERIFERVGDHVGSALGARLSWAIHGVANRNGLAAEAAERVIEHGRLAGDRRLEARGAAGYAIAALYGPVPVRDAIERCEALSESVSGDRRTVAMIGGVLAQLHAMDGQVDRARTLYAESRSMLEELGPGVLAAATSIESARIEILAGDLPEAHAQLRRDYDALSLLGERLLLSTVGGMLARTAYQLDRFEEAAEIAMVVEQIAAPDDIDAQALWRSVLAMVFARERKLDEALRLGSEALMLRRQTDALALLAEALDDFAEVLRFAGREEEGRGLRTEALRLYVAKGDVVSAGRVRTLLA